MNYDYLTLGDGDFTFSLDMCRFLQANAAVEDTLDYMKLNNTPKSGRNTISVVCTGIDLESEVKSKYQDAEFTLKQIMSLNGIVPNITTQKVDHDGAKRAKIDKCSSEIQICIQHGINAILPWELSEKISHLPDISRPRYRNVIFNHPHIGREDAQLHTRFLSHLFHSISNFWLADDGIFHLTLVLGQSDRWKAIQHASMHGLVLLARESFRPPPSIQKFINLKKIEHMGIFELINPYYSRKEGNQSRYQYRRHQSGKSFNSRTNGSETLSFGKIGSSAIHLNKSCLPWQNIEIKEERLICHFCSKSFAEERSRRNHIQSVHQNGPGPFCQGLIVCNECDKKFADKEAFQSHHKAKHSGDFTNIKPDWAQTDTNDGADYDTEKNCCEICGYKYSEKLTRESHFLEFIPKITDIPADANNTSERLPICKKCCKVFRDYRALAQHANWCFISETK